MSSGGGVGVAVGSGNATVGVGGTIVGVGVAGANVGVLNGVFVGVAVGSAITPPHPLHTIAATIRTKRRFIAKERWGKDCDIN
jgi:hypothetical protein